MVVAMAQTIQNINSASNFSTTLKLEGMQFDIWTNGVHGIGISGGHDHIGYELQTVLSGQYCMEFVDQQMQMGALDTLCLIPPGLSHRCCDTGENTRQIALDFNLRRKPGQVSPLGEAADLLPVEKPLLLTGEEPLCHALRQFGRELETPGMASGLMVELLLQQIMLLLLRALKQRSDSGEKLADSDYDLKNTRFNKIETFFHEHYAEPITEEDLARELAVSRRQTSRILRKQCGKSFQEKLEDIRMHYALRYLLQTELPVETVAQLLGYSAPSSFFVVFKRRFSMTPTQYRQKGGQ